MSDLRQYLLSMPGEYIKRGTATDWYFQLREPAPIWIDWRNAKTDGVSSHKFLLNPWRIRRVWTLRLSCGHEAWRPRGRFAKPPKRVKCKECKQ